MVVDVCRAQAFCPEMVTRLARLMVQSKEARRVSNENRGGEWWNGTKRRVTVKEYRQ
jgi:hypothetical protein